MESPSFSREPWKRGLITSTLVSFVGTLLGVVEKSRLVSSLLRLPSANFAPEKPCCGRTRPENDCDIGLLASWIFDFDLFLCIVGERGDDDEDDDEVGDEGAATAVDDEDGDEEVEMGDEEVDAETDIVAKGGMVILGRDFVVFQVPPSGDPPGEELLPSCGLLISRSSVFCVFPFLFVSLSFVVLLPLRSSFFFVERKRGRKGRKGRAERVGWEKVIGCPCCSD